MMVWNGWGILGLIIPLVCSWTANAVVDSIYGDGFYTHSTWAMPLVIGLSSIPVGWIGYRLNGKPGRVLIDPESGEQVVLKTTHSMFWLPLQYWPIVIIAICLWMYAANTGVIYA